MWQKKWIDKVTKSRMLNEVSLTLIWVGFLGVRFAVGGGCKITPCQKLFRIMLLTWNSVHKHTHM